MESLEKKYYKIREVADILGFPASTLRFWETKFTIIKPKRNSKGTRFYTPADIEKLRMIIYLVKDKGLKIEAAQEQIRHNHTNVSRHAQAVERLRDIRATLKSLLDATNSLR
jgi:DNA-binding transcriptional MerR regulator